MNILSSKLQKFSCNDVNYLESYRTCIQIIQSFFSEVEFSTSCSVLFELTFKSLKKHQDDIQEAIENLDPISSFLIIKITLHIFNNRVSFLGKNLNLTELIIEIEDSLPFKDNQFYQNSRDLIKGGQWNENQIFEQLIQKKIVKLQTDIMQKYNSHQYEEILKINNQFFKFSQEIAPYYKNFESFSIQKYIIGIYNKLNNEADKLFQEKKFDDSLNHSLRELGDMERILGKSIPEINSKLQSIINKIKKKINEMSEELIQFKILEKDETSLNSFSKQLILLRKIGNELSYAYEQCLQSIDQILQKQTQKFKEIDTQTKISNILKNDSIGMMIIDENKNYFKETQIKLMIEKTKEQQNINYVKQEMKGDNFNTTSFEKAYKLYENTFNSLLFKITKQELKQSDILEATLKFVTNFKNENYDTVNSNDNNIQWSKKQKEDLIQIVAHTSLVWSVHDCKNKIENIESVRIIHLVQVAAILRILCIDTLENQIGFESNIVQIRTGEGKSFTLGISATILALIGFKVDCCCYSQLLSDRDYQEFLPFFQLFQVDRFIKYGIFDTTVEDFINANQNIRKFCSNYFKGKIEKKEVKHKEKQRKRVLLIDEVDFFFSENFMGQFNITFEILQTTEVYKIFYRNNPSFQQKKTLLDIKIKNMINDVKQMETHFYLTCQPNSTSKTFIGYKVGGNISINTIKGFKTAFAYIQEWQKKIISEDTMRENLTIPITIGVFSYAEIPSLYDKVLGVTGTYTDMSIDQKSKLKENFKIQKITIAPSIYGQNKLKFDPHNNITILDSKEAQYKAIYDRLQEVSGQNRAPIPLQKIITPFEEAENKNFIISKASSKNTKTLATKYFGRGIDFICHDKTVLENGGVHIIQTFFSDEKSEQTQIMGRTSRQSQNGSFEIITQRTQLSQTLNISENDIPKKKEDIYSFLNKKRDDKSHTKCEKISQSLNKISQYHKTSIELKNIINNYSTQKDAEIQKMIEDLNIFTENQNQETNSYPFYNPDAGKISMVNDPKDLDKFNNPKSAEKDLIKANQTNNKNILFGQFYRGEGLEEDIMKLTIPSLQKKGFKEIAVVYSEVEFIQKIEKFDQIWVISSDQFIDKGFENKFVDAIENHIKNGKGLMLWGDNEPFYLHANLILNRIPVGYHDQKQVKINFQGNNEGNKILTNGNPLTAKCFGPHLITTGLQNLHEGITICYPKVVSQTPSNFFGDIQIIGTSSHNVPCVFVLNATKDRGRIVFDCGFTKLMKNYWDTAGTVRYVNNCYGWLYFLEADVEKVEEEV